MKMRCVMAALPGRRALPHLQIRFGAIRKVVDDLRPGHVPEILDPVDEQPVVRGARAVEVPGSCSPLALVDGAAAVNAAERIRHRVLGSGAWPWRRLLAEAVRVGAESEAP